MLRALLYLCIVAASILAAIPGRADPSYPTQPIKIIVPYPPGGATDIVVRGYAPVLTELLGQPIVVDYKPGGGTNIGAAFVARSEPDGYTLYVANFASHAVNRWLFKDLPFDPLTDFTQIAMLVKTPLFLCAKAGSELTSVAQLLEQARQHPGKLNYGSPGYGSPNHIAGELLKQLGQIDVKHVPYKGAAPLNLGLLAGEIDYALDASSIVHHRAGKLKCFGVSSTFRWPTDPEIPSIVESLPGYDLTSFFGIVGPANVPTPIVEKLNQAFRTAARRPEVAKAAEVAAAIPFPATLKETQDFLTEQNSKWGPLVKASGAIVQ